MKENYIFIALFTVIISLPTILIPVYSNTIKTENRELAKAPKLTDLKSPSLFISNFESYYKDHFAGKDILSGFYLQLHNDVLKNDPLPKKVIKGKDGWYFLGDSYSGIFSESLGISKYNDEHIKMIADYIHEMKLYCDSLGIKFYFAVAPEKNRFYAEFLPLKSLENDKRLEKLSKYLIKKYGIEIINLGDYLVSEKKKRRLYYKTDSHWNDYGGFMGTQKLLECIKRDFKDSTVLLNLSEYVEYSIPKKRMDLNLLINKDIAENEIRLKPSDNSKSIEIDTLKTTNPRKSYLLHSAGNKSKLKSIVFRDSYFNAMINFYANAMGESKYVWSLIFDREIIKKEKPNLVIFQVVERHLYDLDKRNQK